MNGHQNICITNLVNYYTLWVKINSLRLSKIDLLAFIIKNKVLTFYLVQLISVSKTKSGIQLHIINS